MKWLALVVSSLALLGGCGVSGENTMSHQQVLAQLENRPVEEQKPQALEQAPVIKKADQDKEKDKETYSCWRDDEKNPGSKIEIKVDKDTQSNSWTAVYKSGAISLSSNHLSCRFIAGQGNNSSYCYDQNPEHRTSKTYLSAVEKTDHIEIRLQSPELKKPEVMVFALGVKTAGCTGLF